MNYSERLAKKLEPMFSSLPPLPKEIKEWLVKAWPVIAIVFGVLQLLAVWGLWRAGHLVNNLVNYTNQLSNIYGGGIVSNQLGVFYWLSLIVLVVEAVILLLAYPGLKARASRGWDLLFLGAMINVVYGLVSAFDSSNGGVGKFVMTLVGSAIGLYFLFQVRSYYKVKSNITKTA